MADAHPGGEASTAPLGERALWSTRLLIVAAVIGSALLALAVMWLATVDLVRFLGDVARYTTDDTSTARSDLIATVVKIVDTYLLAAILVVVAIGLYELFVRPLHTRRSGDGSRVLVARSPDDLKDRIAKLVVLILVIEFFQRALKTTISSPTDLLVLAAAIALITVAVVLPTAVEILKRKHPNDGP